MVQEVEEEIPQGVDLMRQLSDNAQNHGSPPGRLREGRRVAALATVLTLLLVVAKGLVGYVRHSPALMADAVHSAADTLAIFASWVGLRLADRPPTKRFPFGLYKAETLASLLVSAIILVAGVNLLLESMSGLIRGGALLPHSLDVLVVALASSVLSFGIFVWEKRVGGRLNSQSLLANADESRADIITSLAVFVGAGASYLGVSRVELIVAAGLSLIIIWLGAKHGRAAVYVLLDASLDRDLEQRAADIAEELPGVLAVEQVRLRRAGPFCFGIAHIAVRKSADVARSHELAHKVEEAVRAAIPRVETLTVHMEPFHPDKWTVMVPTDAHSLDAPVSKHFGRAKYFLFATVSSDCIQQTEFIENPFRRNAARAGLAVIKEALQNRKVDAVVVRQIGEIAFHTLRDHYVDIYEAPKGSSRDTLTQFAAQKLHPVIEPSHASEAAGAPEEPNGVDTDQ